MTPRIAVFVLMSAIAAPSFAQTNGRTKGKTPNPPPNMSCEQIVASSHGSVSLEACKQMMGVQQSFDAAASDPSASRPGDDKMTCDQIAAEIKQQPFTPPDQAKVTEAQAAATDFKETADKQQKEATALAIKETA